MDDLETEPTCKSPKGPNEKMKVEGGEKKTINNVPAPFNKVVTHAIIVKSDSTVD